MNFSERMGLVPIRQIQTDDIDIALKHRIINLIQDRFSDAQARYVLDLMGFRTIAAKDIFEDLISHESKNLNKLITVLTGSPWNTLYDVIEYGYKYIEINCDDCTSNCNSISDEDNEDDRADEDEEPYTCKYKIQMDEYSKEFNSILEREKSAYRLIDGVISPIVEKIEIACIEEASHVQFSSVNIHLRKALRFYSDRENPDYENSIKEAISAVEAVCCIITEMSGAQATLGNALKRLEDRGIALHGALKSAFEKMYGYTSDADGIRHGGIDFKNAPAEDAKYMLISCSAFVNYLMEKLAKLGKQPNGQDKI